MLKLTEEEKTEELTKKAVDRWIKKYRDRKLKRMERARLAHERGPGSQSGGVDRRFSRLTSTMTSSGGSSISSGGPNATESRKMHIMQAKLKHHLIKKKQKEKAERRRLVKKQQRLQIELEYVNFPTIMGWYFDGFFTQPFSLNEQYAAMFNELEEGIAHKKEMSFKETFTEKTRRNFWPPQLIGSNCFRSRGVYMDHYETKKDPPHTPPQIDFEHIKPGASGGMSMFMDPNSSSFYDEEKAKRPSKVKFVELDNSTTSVKQPYMRFGRMGSTHSVDTVDEEEEVEEDDDEDISVPQVMRYGRKKKYNKQPTRSKMFYRIREESKKSTAKKTDYYFDDEKVGFFKKKKNDQHMYYYDVKYEVWRIKRTPRTFATDFYFDSVAGAFLPKDRSRKETDYSFDSSFYCYILNGQRGPPKNGLTPDDYAFDEKIGKWRKIDGLPEAEKKSVGVDYNASRFAIKGVNKTPDDYYFDVETGLYELKTEVDRNPDKYVYNAVIGTWVMTAPPEGEKEEGEQKAKAKITPNFYFWDETKYCFRRKNGPSAYFIYDPNNKFYRMKKSIRGKYNPKNWRWDDTKKEWYLQKSQKGGYFNEELHWLPERDYDKPWLEYVGGYFYGPRKDSFEDEDNAKESNIVNAKDGLGAPSKATATGATATPVGAKPAPGGKPAIGGQPVAGGKPAAGGATAQGKKSVAEEPTPTAIARKIPTKVVEEEKPKVVEEEKSALDKALEAHDLFDPRVLKVHNLGFVINEVDLKAFFPSVIKVLRPKLFDSDVNDDFALLYFLTDEAASAALKTMNKQKIKGVIIYLTYCKKEDKKIFEHRFETREKSAKRKKST